MLAHDTRKAILNTVGIFPDCLHKGANYGLAQADMLLGKSQGAALSIKVLSCIVHGNATMLSGISPYRGCCRVWSPVEQPARW